MKSITVTHDKRTLTRSIGYWSSKPIYCNLSTDLMILCQPLSTEVLLQECKNLQKQITTLQHFKDYFIPWLGGTYRGQLDIRPVVAESNWSNLQKQLQEKRYNKQKMSKYIADLWWQYNKQSPSQGIEISKLNRIPIHLSPLVINWSNLINDDTDDFVLKISNLSQLTTIADKTLYPNFSKMAVTAKSQIFVTNLSMEERALFEWAMPNLSNITDEACYYHSAGIIIEAAAAMLAWLRIKGLLILPINLGRVTKWLPDLGIWNKKLLKSREAKPVIKNGLFQLIASTTVDHIDDLPDDLLQIYKTKYFKPSFYRALAEWVNHPAIEKKRRIFPIDRLHFKQLKDKGDKAWTPAWIKKHYNDEWYSFVCEYWRHPSTDSHKTGVLRDFLRWACDERKFESPWDITETDLRNPHHPTDKTSYSYYLKHNKVKDKGRCWSGSATLFRVTCLYANMPDSPALLYGVLKNPFENLENPFRNRGNPKDKTHRVGLPAAIHELMIEILLSLDDEGEPTFSWAIQELKSINQDIVKVPDPDHPLEILDTLCPSRITCLAILLLTPLRNAQARWLDQGLMDEECYDVRTRTIVPNQHELRNFRYTNGKSHTQQYGRPTGVLQLSSDILTETNALSIFVNTNKTQLWSGTRTSGYEIPWPDGTELLNASDPALQDKGKWLARVYKVLEYQMTWMTRYDPNPYPISFFQSPEDANRTTDLEEVQDSLPKFVPLFRDLSFNNFVSVGDGFKGHCPVSYSKIMQLYYRLCIETEKRMLKLTGQKISLIKNNNCKFDLHSLRVTWVARLFEMGVPIDIISEYIVGHTTQVMTLYYLKTLSTFVREKIISAVNEHTEDYGFEALLKRIMEDQEIQDCLLNNSQQDIFKYLPDDFTTIVPVPGGICPVGGKESMCSKGGITSNKNTPEARENSPVKGGCGNCRFFLTGPDFILTQLLTCNNLLYQMRELAKEQNKLYNQLNDNKRQLHEIPPEEFRRRNHLEQQGITLSASIEEYNERLVPLMLEWLNRHEMLFMSSELLQEDIAADDKKLILLGNQQISAEAFRVSADPTTEFDFICKIVEQARFVPRQGYPMPEGPARMLREFLYILLSAEPRELLLRIPDDEYTTHVASILSGILTEEFGDSEIQEHLNQKKPLPIDCILNERLHKLTKKLHDNYFHEKVPVSTLFIENEKRGKK